MRIQSVCIKNFRCLRYVRVDFDEVTTFIGPNGSGKSSILYALNWFFNSEPTMLTEEDVYAGADPGNRKVEVEVVFADLTDRDREALGDRYAPAGTTTFTAWRTWSVEGGDKVTGKAYAYPPFEEVRGRSNAADKRAAYTTLARNEPDLCLPKWTKMDDAERVMATWERANPGRLGEATVESTHFFGFNEVISTR